MKKLLGIALGVILLLLLSYFVTGIITEKTLKKDIALINKTSGFEVYLKDYNRGWFSSKANFDWIFVVPARTVPDTDRKIKVLPAKSYTVAMPLTIHHGPVIFSNNALRFGFGYAQTALNLPTEYLEQFNQLFVDESVKPKVDVNVLVSFLNRSRFVIDVPEFKLISKEDGSQFNWQGMNNVITLSGSLNRVKGDLDINGFSITKDKHILKFNNLESNYHLNKTVNGLLLGEAQISCNEISAIDNDTERLKLKDLTINTSSNIKDNLFAGTIKFTFDTLKVQNEVYGPLKINLLIENIDADALSTMNEKLGKIDNNNMKQQILWTVLPDLPRLLNQGVHVEIKDSMLHLPLGRIAVDLDFGLHKGDLDNPLVLMQKLQGQGKIVIAKPVLGKIVLDAARQQLTQKRVQEQTEKYENAITESLEQQNVENNVELSPQGAPNGMIKAVEENNADGSVNNNETTNIETNEGRRAPRSSSNVLDKPEDIVPGGVVKTQKVIELNPQEIETKSRVEAHNRIRKMLDSQLLTQDDKDFIINLKYTNGKLFVNEREFDSSMLNF